MYHVKKNVSIYFRTNYSTYPGEMLFVIGDHKALGNWDRKNSLQMHYQKNDSVNWVGKLDIEMEEDEEIKIEYKYIVLTYYSDNNSGDIRIEKDVKITWEYGPNRVLTIGKLSKDTDKMIVTTTDLFQSSLSRYQDILCKMPFKDVIYKHEIEKSSSIVVSNINMLKVCFRIAVLQIPPNFNVFITGTYANFNNWEKLEILKPINSIYWEFCMEVPRDIKDFNYKYLIKEKNSDKKIWEDGRNRTFKMPNEYTDILIINDWIFELPKQIYFKGAGLLVPLFSVHSKNSMCKIGEFMDLKLLIDWAVKANFLIIQLLPIQDTYCCFSKNEVNPSRQVSAFAFNPMYLSLRCIKGYTPKEMPKQKDFLSLTKFKLQELKKIFNETIDINQLRKDKVYIEFVKKNIFWLPSYCIWCSIRDKAIQKEPNVLPKWPEISTVRIPDLLKDPISFDEYTNQCIFISWVQFQCHLQLLEVSKYALKNRIILSSLMTIGQNLNSVDTWTHPEWFDFNYTIGAPPDIFSFQGQNWYYPAWNWGTMKESNFYWLRQQLNHREQYFQTAMFDHPLGLFRCWNIPSSVDNPLFGHFEPSMPINIQDLYNLQIHNVESLYVPIFPINDILSLNLPEKTKERLINSLAVYKNNIWRFKKEFKSDRDVVKEIKQIGKDLTIDERFQLKIARKIILSSFESICLIPDLREPTTKFYPRFSMTDSNVFKSLPERDAQILYKLYVDFYYRTNIDLWHQQGHQKLSVLASSQMQFFGYDLGFTLDDEENALHQVGICSFRVQRVTRESSFKFDQTSNFPYLSVCTPSPQDMPHLKLLWSTNQADVQTFYYQILKMEGVPPKELTTEIAKVIIQQHLESSSMWCLFQFEDLFAIDEKLTKLISSKYINNPAKKHNWDYHVGIPLEELCDSNREWTQIIANLIEINQRGRNADFGF